MRVCVRVSVVGFFLFVFYFLFFLLLLIGGGIYSLILYKCFICSHVYGPARVSYILISVN